MDVFGSGSAARRAVRAAWFAAALTFVLFAGAADAGAWWSEEWQYRKKLGFDTSASGLDVAENLSFVPVLLRLHAGNWNFANAAADGTDIRFVAADEKTLLKYHIEKYDAADETGLLWLQVPSLAGGQKTEFVWVYYGNPKAVGGQDAGGTYDASQAAVWHLAEAEGPPKDSTAYANNVTAYSGVQGMPSIIYKGVVFSGAGDKMSVAASPSLDFKAGFTLAAWVRVGGPVEDGWLFCRESGDKRLVAGVDGASAYIRVEPGGGAPAIETERSVSLSPGAWHHLAFTIEPAGRMSAYLDGLPVTYTQLPTGIPPLDGPLAIGGSPADTFFFTGDVDEVSISNTARPAAAIRALARSQRQDANWLMFSEEELADTGMGMPALYLDTVIENITLDGWLIIGVLGVFAVLSWIVFFMKTMLFQMMGRLDRRFAIEFENAPDLFALEGREKEYGASPRYRVYAAAMKELVRVYGGAEAAGRVKNMPPVILKSVTASMERTYTRETQRFNAWVLILTLSVSGGPFLGLLGTVWGVMSTFAALAEAGEANLAAIAPGVASALSTTVVGLLVAIPALFAYNYLAARIRFFSTETGLFIDELANRLEATHGGN
jgi:biopolymer transport protein ExbB